MTLSEQMEMSEMEDGRVVACAEYAENSRYPSKFAG